MNEVANKFEYKSPSSFYRRYGKDKGKSLLDHMLDIGYLKVEAGKEDRKIKYLSSIEKFVPDNDAWFFKKYRKFLFDFEKLKILFRFNELEERGFQRFGVMFWPFISSLVFRYTAELPKYKEKQKLEEAGKNLKEVKRALGDAENNSKAGEKLEEAIKALKEGKKWGEERNRVMKTALEVTFGVLDTEGYLDRTFRSRKNDEEFVKDRRKLLYGELLDKD